MKTFFKRLFTVLIILLVSYSFLSLCNWSLNAEEWNGFSRFILGTIGVIGVLELFDVHIR
jgi:hypothetical protein